MVRTKRYLIIFISHNQYKQNYYVILRIHKDHYWVGLLILNKTYHDEKIWFPPIEDDNELFGRLLLEINQAQV